MSTVTETETVGEAQASGRRFGAAEYFRGPWTIAVHTWREGIRKKILVAFLILSLLVIFGASFLTTALDPTADTDMSMKLIKDISITTIDIFGVLIAIFIAASVVPAEMDNKVIYTVLSKPVRRFQYLLGKFAGVQLIVIVNLLLMGGLFVTALYMRQQIFPSLLLWSMLLMYFQFLIVSAFTFAISCTSTSAVLPTIGGLFIYLVGNLTEYLKDVAVRSADATEWFSRFIGHLSSGLHYVLPNLQHFSLKTQILAGQPNDPPADAQIPWMVLYGIVYGLSGFLLAYWIFRRREL